MARIAPVNPTTATGKLKEIFDGPLAGKHFNLFKSLAASPAALQGYLGLAGALGHGSLSAREREAAQLAIAEANGCEYCQAAHTAIGKGAGLTEEQTQEARRGAVKDAKIGALVKFVLALHEKRGNASDADVAAFRAAGYGDGHIAEVVGGYALALYTNYFNILNQTPVDFPAVKAV